MFNVYMFFALVGGTVLICQFVLTLVGMGGDHAEMGGHAGGEVGGAFADGSSDFASPDGHDAGGHHGSTWLFGVITFRTLVAATAFFGLCGLVADSLQQPPVLQFIVALAGGAVAMYTVHYILKLFGRFSEDGTVRIRRAIGEEGTVYLSIPPLRSGIGKIHLNVQHRLMEYPAVTAGDEKLPTGTKVVVTGVTGSDTLEVEALAKTVAHT
ncbi:MAG: NfeD family protein [Pirellulaceae bacterium]